MARFVKFLNVFLLTHGLLCVSLWAFTGSMYPDNIKHSGYLEVNPLDTSWQSWKSDRFLAVKDSAGKLFTFSSEIEKPKKSQEKKKKKLKLIQFNKKKKKEAKKDEKRKKKSRKKLWPFGEKKGLYGKDRHVGTEDVKPKEAKPDSD